MGSLWKSSLALVSPAGPSAKLQIFTFHRVLDAPSDLCPGEPCQEEFRQKISWISEICNVLPLNDAATRLAKGTLPAAAAVITFDDGYRNNLTNALPVLEQFGVPATIFLAAGACRDGIMWNDLVIEGVAQCKTEFEMQIGSRQHRFDAQTDPQAVLDIIKYQPHDQRAEIATSFFRYAARTDPPRLMLTPEEIADCGSELINFGAHTVSHPILKNLNADESASEILDSKRFVQEWTNKEVDVFAYPNGRRGIDFDQREMKTVAEAGFITAVATDWGSANAKSDLFALPRYTPWESGSFRFKSRVLKTTLTS